MVLINELITSFERWTKKYEKDYADWEKRTEESKKQHEEYKKEWDKYLKNADVREKEYQALLKWARKQGFKA